MTSRGSAAAAAAGAGGSDGGGGGGGEGEEEGTVSSTQRTLSLPGIGTSAPAIARTTAAAMATASRRWMKRVFVGVLGRARDAGVRSVICRLNSISSVLSYTIMHSKQISTKHINCNFSIHKIENPVILKNFRNGFNF